MGKDFTQERMKNEMRGHTSQASQPGRRCEVGGEGKFLGTSCDGCLGGDPVGFSKDESEGAGKAVLMKSIK